MKAVETLAWACGIGLVALVAAWIYFDDDVDSPLTPETALAVGAGTRQGNGDGAGSGGKGSESTSDSPSDNQTQPASDGRKKAGGGDASKKSDAGSKSGKPDGSQGSDGKAGGGKSESKLADRVIEIMRRARENQKSAPGIKADGNGPNGAKKTIATSDKSTGNSKSTPPKSGKTTLKPAPVKPGTPGVDVKTPKVDRNTGVAVGPSVGDAGSKGGGLAPPPVVAGPAKKSDLKAKVADQPKITLPKTEAKGSPPPVVKKPGPPVPNKAERRYKIKSGDTLSSIAEDFYGEERKWTVIAKANPKLNPNRLRVGEEIVLPDVAAIAKKKAEEAKKAKDAIEKAVGPAGERTVIVESGDTLSGISKKVYGKASKWRVIFNANKKLLPRPDDLKVGMKLTIPKLIEEKKTG